MLLFTLSIISHAQWYLGLGYNRITDQLFWTHGSNFQIEYKIPIKLQSTYIAIGGNYNIFFNSNNLPNLVTPAVMGFHREFSVQLFQFIDLLAKVEHRFSYSGSYLFASLGFGICYHSASPVKMREWIDTGGQLVPSFQAYNPPEYTLEPSYRLALGYNISFSSKFSMRPEICYFNCFQSRIIRSPVNIGIFYML